MNTRNNRRTVFCFRSFAQKERAVDHLIINTNIPFTGTLPEANHHYIKFAADHFNESLVDYMEPALCFSEFTPSN